MCARAGDEDENAHTYRMFTLFLFGNVALLVEGERRSGK